MKKRILAYLLLAAVVIISAGCSEKGNIYDSEYLRSLEESNSYEALVTSKGNFRSVSNIYYGDGSTFESTLYAEKDMYLLTDEEGTLVISNGEVYGYAVDDGFYKYLFPGNFQHFYESVNRLWNMTGEEVLSGSKKNGLIYIETSTEQADKIEYYADYYRYNKEDIEKVFINYVVDPEDNVIRECQEYLMIKGEKILCNFGTIKCGVEKSVPDQKIIDALSGTDTRTLTVITDGGTAQEKAYSRTVPKGCGIYVFFGNDFEPVRYGDKECTVEVPEADCFNDATYYLKRITE